MPSAKQVLVIFYNKITKALDYANSKKVPYVIFIGENEVKADKYTLKNMSSGKEQKSFLKDIIKLLIFGLMLILD